MWTGRYYHNVGTLTTHRSRTPTHLDTRVLGLATRVDACDRVSVRVVRKAERLPRGQSDVHRLTVQLRPHGLGHGDWRWRRDVHHTDTLLVLLHELGRRKCSGRVRGHGNARCVLLLLSGALRVAGRAEAGAAATSVG